METTLPTLELTAKEIAQSYKAALDSVSLINSLVAALPERMTEEERVDSVKRNVEHLELTVAKDHWTTENLTPLKSAIAAGKSFAS